MIFNVCYSPLDHRLDCRMHSKLSMPIVDKDNFLVDQLEGAVDLNEEEMQILTCPSNTHFVSF